MGNFDVKITSDTVCPWCFIGLRRLQRGITDFQKANPSTPHTFTVTWHPFYLDPDAPLPSIPKVQSYMAKFGPERAKQIVSNLTTVGEQEGIAFSFLGKTGRTRDSHRLLAWAAQPSTANGTTTADADANAGTAATATPQSRLATELFKSYFEREEDITTHAVLAAAAARAGLPEDEARAFLADDTAAPAGAAVDAEAAQARHGDGVTGVPHFVINDRFEVSGAQEPAAFAQLFERLLKIQAA